MIAPLCLQLAVPRLLIPGRASTGHAFIDYRLRQYPGRFFSMLEELLEA